MSSVTRVTGMATGMDTDATVKALMKPYQMRIDKLNQDKQLVQWKQDLYRDVLTDLNSFQSSYFDIINPTNNMLSKKAYSDFDVKTYDHGTTNISSGVSASAVTGAVAGTYKVDFTGGQIAVAAGVQSNVSISGALASTKLSDLGGTGVINTSKITISYTQGDGTSGSQDVNIDATMTLSDLAQAINSKTSGAVMARFSELTGKFTVQTSSTGANSKLSITDASATKDLLGKLNLGIALVDETTAGYNIAPQSLSVLITPPGGNPTPVANRSSNSFVIDSVFYSFSASMDNSAIPLPVKADIVVAPNVQNTVDRIKGFIDKYNEIVDKLNTKIDEKKQYTYLPLTADQKSAMKPEEITAWEDKAKVGLLKGDSILSNMLDSMRSAFYDDVKDAGITLSDVGLSTSPDITQRGKILIDETKLKDAIQNKGDQVANLFSKTSTSKPDYSATLNATDRGVRTKEEGIFQRIKDILMDNTRTTPSYKGMILVKAGIKGDFTEYQNILTKDLDDRQKYIDDMTKRMSDKEDQYYAQFAKLETAMNKLNSQSSWLSQQLGTSSK